MRSSTQDQLAGPPVRNDQAGTRRGGGGRTRSLGPSTRRSLRRSLRPGSRTAAIAAIAAIAAVAAVASVTAALAQDGPTRRPSGDSRAVAAPQTALRLGLAQAVALALESDEVLRQASEAILAAESDVTAAASGRLPRLDLAGEWTANLKKPAFFLPPEFGAGFGGATKVEMGRDFSLQGAASLSWNLWTAGRLSAAVGAARELVAASRWRRDAVADAVRYQARAAYLDVLLAAEHVSIATRARSTTSEALRIARAGFAQGTVSEFEVLRARVELANREAPLIQARNARRQAELVLARACGLPTDAVLVLTDSLAAVPPPAPERLLLQAMQERSPELRALHRQVAATEQALALARAGRGPVVQLRGQYAVQAEWDRDLAPGHDERATSASAGVAVSVPVFDGLQSKAEIRGARADLRTAELELERITADRRLAVQQARLQLENAQAALAGRREGVALAEEAYRLAMVRLENGLATPLERLDAELALTDARVQLAVSLHRCNLARAALELAVGADLDSLTAPATEEDSP